MKPKVLVTGESIAKKFLDQLSDAGFDVHNPTHLLGEEELAHELKDSSAYLIGGDEFASAATLKDADKLKVIAFLGMDYAAFVDGPVATAKGIPITNTPGTLTQSMVEFTLGQMIDISRHITAANNTRRSPGSYAPVKTHDLASSTIGIVGLGAIGEGLARLLRPGFGAKVNYFSRTRKTHVEDEIGIKYVELDGLLETSDFVVILVSQNDQTVGMIGEREISLMKPGSYLINTSRPAIVDAKALSAALKSDKIAGATMDMYFVEPLPEITNDPYEILELPDTNLILTPHIGSMTHEARDAMSQKSVDSIINIYNGRPDPHIVNGVEVKS